MLASILACGRSKDGARTNTPAQIQPVTVAAVAGISVAPSTLTMPIGSSTTVVTTVTALSGLTTAATLESSDRRVVTVSRPNSTGATVQAVGAGTAVITAKAVADSSVTATIAVSVPSRPVAARY